VPGRELEGRTAVVCGSSTGMGLGIAEALADAGAAVVMFSNDAAGLESEARRLGATPVSGDLTRSQDRERLIAEAVEAHGGLDIVVLNGGGPADSGAVEVTEEQLRAGFELVLVPMVHIAQLALPHLRESPAGRIVAITSTSVREPIDGLVVSNALRPGLVGWLKTLSREVGRDGITVNAIAPGRIETRTFAEFYEHRSRDADLEEIPLGRFGTPREIGEVVRFLASDGGAYVTGAQIPVDGGLGRSMC
jgi:3-oxoacyl-[acyl-carrier protein] reductase